MVGHDAETTPADRWLVVASDIEMGPGGPADDCPRSEEIVEVLASRMPAEGAVDLVFNGDTLDFLKTPYRGRHPRHITEAIALDKLERILAAHERFFDGVAALLAREARTAHFVVGNHDLELWFPAVQDRLRARLGGDVRFPGMTLSIGDVRIEHGSQHDPLFVFDASQPFIDHLGERILNLPWGAVGLLDAVLPWHAELYALDRIRPKQALFEVLPEAETFAITAARRYWLVDFWRDLLIHHDPLKRISGEMVREILRRFLKRDTEVSFGDAYLEELRTDPHHRVYVLGHEHREREVRFDDRTLLVTGCLRDEYVLDARTLRMEPKDRSIAEVRLEGGRAVEARLVRLPVSAGALASVPDDPRRLAPALLRSLRALNGRSRARDDNEEESPCPA